MGLYRSVRRLYLLISVSPRLVISSSRLATETLDDLTATERAARTHPDAPPRLPPLPFADHAEEMSKILFAPELIAPPPIVWLPSDRSGVARAEARDLEHYHGLRAVIEVRSSDDVILRRHHLNGNT
jgi:calcium permeable stress-gated cation channel